MCVYTYVCVCIYIYIYIHVIPRWRRAASARLEQPPGGPPAIVEYYTSNIHDLSIYLSIYLSLSSALAATAYSSYYS